ncbi:O-methyltransferase [Ureaplasma ceti]|uniref:O-methyltransferase n=1 Tax=Ureaplasma ceti TaxID=3119530 RepID=A0ABP9UC44_9BACT
MNLNNNQVLLDLCLQDNIPIIRDQTAFLIEKIILENNFHSLFEVGTAYGYSASLWIQIPQLTNITTIEKNEANHVLAKQYVHHDNLHLVLGDAFTYEPETKFDLIFIDGPKSHQENLITHYIEYLNPNGIIVIDNLFLNKIRQIPEELRSKNQNNLIKKLDDFVLWLQRLPNWSFKFLDLDDGIGILKRV